LAFVHANEIVHGRVHEVCNLSYSQQPSVEASLFKGNILVDDNGVTVLCDAGLDLTIISDDKRRTIPSRSRWMPYECLIPDENGVIAPPNMSADVYGAGEWQMWTLRCPFDHVRNEYKFFGMLRGLKTGQLSRLERPERVPAPVWALLERCLSIHPQVRLAASEMLASFEELVVV